MIGTTWGQAVGAIPADENDSVIRFASGAQRCGCAEASAGLAAAAPPDVRRSGGMARLVIQTDPVQSRHVRIPASCVTTHGSGGLLTARNTGKPPPKNAAPDGKRHHGDHQYSPPFSDMRLEKMGRETDDDGNGGVDESLVSHVVEDPERLVTVIVIDAGARSSEFDRHQKDHEGNERPE